MDRTLLMQLRQSLLMAVDAIERALKLKPRTSQLRRELKTTLFCAIGDQHPKAHC
jgi:hypothetical protein